MDTSSTDERFRLQELAGEELVAALSAIPGGRDLIDWFIGAPSFHDGEVISISLTRCGSSFLRIALDQGRKSAVISFELTHWIDVNVLGFSNVNVIEELKLRRAEEREIQPWELGVGCQPGEWVIELLPCFGAYGSIRANIARIVIDQTLDQPIENDR